MAPNRLLPKSVLIWLILSLAAPHSAYPLRETATAEKDPRVRAGLEDALRSGDPQAVVGTLADRFGGLAAAGMEDAASVRILIADTPQRETVPGSINALIERMGLQGKVRLIEERGITGNQRKLRELAEKYRPTLVLVFTGQPILMDPYVVQAVSKSGIGLVIRAGAGYENFSTDAMTRYKVPFLRSHGLGDSMTDFTIRFLLAGLRIWSGKQSDPSETDISDDPELGSLVRMSPAVFHEALEQAMLRKRGEMTPEQKARVYGPISRAEFSELVQGLAGKRVGVLGFGVIGEKVIRRLDEIKKRAQVSFEIVVAAPSLMDPDSEQAAAARDLDVKIVDPAELFQTSDIVSIHIPSTDGNRRGITPRHFAGRAKPLILINTAREDLIDRALFRNKQPFDLTFLGDIDYDAEILAFREANPDSFFPTPHIGGLTSVSALGAIEYLLRTLETVIPVFLGQGDPASIRTINGVPIVPVISELHLESKKSAGMEEGISGSQARAELQRIREDYLKEAPIQGLLRRHSDVILKIVRSAAQRAEQDLWTWVPQEVLYADGSRDTVAYPPEDPRVKGAKQGEGVAYQARNVFVTIGGSAGRQDMSFSPNPEGIGSDLDFFVMPADEQSVAYSQALKHRMEEILEGESEENGLGFEVDRTLTGQYDYHVPPEQAPRALLGEMPERVGATAWRQPVIRVPKMKSGVVEPDFVAALLTATTFRDLRFVTGDRPGFMKLQAAVEPYLYPYDDTGRVILDVGRAHVQQLISETRDALTKIARVSLSTGIDVKEVLRLVQHFVWAARAVSGVETPNVFEALDQLSAASVLTVEESGDLKEAYEFFLKVQLALLAVVVSRRRMRWEEKKGQQLLSEQLLSGVSSRMIPGLDPSRLRADVGIHIERILSIVDRQLNAISQRLEAGMEEAGAAEVRRRVGSWINLPGVQLEIERRGGSFRFAEEVRSAAGEERRYGGVLIRLKDARIPSRSGLLFAQAALMRQLQAETAATALKNLPWIELTSNVSEAARQLRNAQARRGLDLALFSTPRDPRARQALADRVQRKLSEAMLYPADPPRAVLLGRAQVLALHPLLLDYWTTAELHELPPVVILLLTDTIQDKAGSEYALAIWL